MIKHKCLFLNVVLFAWTALTMGCSLAPEKRDPPTVFDFGPPRAVAQNAAPINITLLIAPIAASPWFDKPQIYYRMASDTSRADAYANHQWTQSQAVLLTERIRARMAHVVRGVVGPLDGARADYSLRVDLEDFTQLFAGEQSSTVNVRMRASLIDVNTRALRAQKTFATERAAPPNATGAARSLMAAADAVIEDMAAWAAQTLK